MRRGPGEQFFRRKRLPVSAEEAFLWHSRPEALEQLIPPGESFRVIEREGALCNGARIVFLVGIGPFRRRWVSVHDAYIENRQFRDVQISGPFAKWEHLHRFEPDGPSGCWLEDRIDYVLPFGWIGRLLAGRFVRKRLENLFAYRHEVTARALSAGQEASTDGVEPTLERRRP